MCFAIKELCARKLDEVCNLHSALKTRLIARDLHILAEKNPERLKILGKNYILDDKIIVCIDKDGNLNVIDDRATAFLWLFEIEFTEAVCVGDAFKYGNKIYSVSYLNGNEFECVCDEVQNVIASIDEAIIRMKTKTDLNMWAYKYYDCDRKICCDNLDEVVSAVVGRKPTCG